MAGPAPTSRHGKRPPLRAVTRPARPCPHITPVSGSARLPAGNGLALRSRCRGPWQVSSVMMCRGPRAMPKGRLTKLPRARRRPSAFGTYTNNTCPPVRFRFLSRFRNLPDSCDGNRPSRSLWGMFAWGCWQVGIRSAVWGVEIVEIGRASFQHHQPFGIWLFFRTHSYNCMSPFQPLAQLLESAPGGRAARTAAGGMAHGGARSRGDGMGAGMGVQTARAPAAWFGHANTNPACLNAQAKGMPYRQAASGEK